jgi:nucleoside-diphosphate-sugar epimerase
MNKIALFGAAGAIGHNIAKAVSVQGAPYRVVGRSRDALAAAFGAESLAEIVTWNPDDAASVQAAAADVDAIVYLVGVNYWQFELHPRLMKQTLDGAIAAGVNRIVLIGTVYPYGRPRTKPVREDHPREPHTFKGRMRKAQEDLLLAAHAEEKIQATILRLPDFYGPGVDKSFLHSAFAAAVNGGVANMIGPLDTPHEFVFVPDVGPVVARLTSAPNAYGRWWHLAGAGVTTQRAIIDEIERQIGHPLRVRAAGKTMLRLLGVFNPLMREMVEMHYLVTDPVLMDDTALQELLGPTHKTSYPAGVRECLAAKG